MVAVTIHVFFFLVFIIYIRSMWRGLRKWEIPPFHLCKYMLWIISLYFFSSQFKIRHSFCQHLSSVCDCNIFLTISFFVFHVLFVSWCVGAPIPPLNPNVFFSYFHEFEFHSWTLYIIIENTLHWLKNLLYDNPINKN